MVSVPLTYDGRTKYKVMPPLAQHWWNGFVITFAQKEGQRWHSNYVVRRTLTCRVCIKKFNVTDALQWAHSELEVTSVSGILRNCGSKAKTTARVSWATVKWRRLRQVISVFKCGQAKIREARCARWPQNVGFTK